MSLKQFDHSFQLASLDEEKRRFVNRIQYALFDQFRDILSKDYHLELFNRVCFLTGENSEELLSRLFGGWEPNFALLGKGDFTLTLRTIVAIFQATNNSPELQERTSDAVEQALNAASIDLGVKWVDGVFFPVGEPLLDHELLEESLRVLNNLPNERKDITLALENYQAGRLYGVVDHCYKAIEGITRHLLNNRKSLIANKQDLLRSISLSSSWGTILANYIEYANEYHRHAGESRHDLKPAEVESFLYLSCVMIRLCLRIKNENDV
jgi:hypothetical protein